MKKYLLTLLIVSLLLPVSQAALSPTAKNWYQFGSVYMPLSTDKVEYSPGDIVVISGRVQNNNTFPLTEGRVRLQIFYHEGAQSEYMLGEFFAADNLYLQPNGTKEFGAIWEIPTNAREGTYTIEAYYAIDEFNMAGVSFLRNVVGDRASFSVVGGTELLHMDTQGISVNGQSVSLNDFQPQQTAGNTVTVTVPLVNIGVETSAEVTYQLYSWDDLRQDSLLSERTENVNIPANSQATLTYISEPLNSGAYLLKISVESGKNDNILKIRIPVSGKRVKTNFLGLDKFPVTAGEDVTVFVCASNSADYSNNVSSEISLRVIDKNGNAVFSDSSSQMVPPDITCYDASFKASNNYDWLNLSSRITDEAGNIESVDLVYTGAPAGCPNDLKTCSDGSKVGRVLPGCDFVPCPEVQPEKPTDNTQMILIIIAVLVVVIAGLVYAKRRK